MYVSITNQHVPRRRLNTPVILIQRMVFIITTLMIKLFLYNDFFDNTVGLIFNTIILLSYLVAESYNLWRFDSRLFFINPVILASWLSTIGLPYGICNIVYFVPDHYFYGMIEQPDITSWMNQVMLLVMIGSCAMWIGYSSTIGSVNTLKFRHSRFAKWVKQSSQVNLTTTYLLVVIAIASRILMVKLGIFGYISGDVDVIENTTVTTAGYSQFLNTFSRLYSFALYAIALQAFSLTRSNKTLTKQLILLVVIELFFGLLSGSKGPMIFTLLIIGQIYYSQRNRFPTFLIPILFASLLVAYAVVEPYRQAMTTNQTRANSLSEIVSTMFTSEAIHLDDEQKPAVFLQALNRISMTWSASFGIEYAAVNEKLPSDSPDFLGNILMAPIYAFVPRFLMSDKPLGDLGLWYTREVIGINYYTYTAMGPFSYLNFAGGLFAVVIGFYFIGILQRYIFDVFTHLGIGGFFIYFSFLGSITIINSSIDSMIIGIIRDMLLVLIVMFFLLKQRPSLTRQKM